MEFLESNVLLISLTFLTYWGALRLQKLTGLLVLNPVLITILVIIGYLKLLGVTYDTYYDSGRMIEFWLKPAIVSLGVPLYLQMKQIRRQFLPIFISQLAGCLAGIVSVVLRARWLGATREVVLSLAPKSVTTPIAIEVSQKIGGVASLTAAIVVCVGLLGAILGSKMMTMGRVGSPVAREVPMT